MGVITALAFCLFAGGTPTTTPDECVWFEWADAPRATEADCRDHIARLEFHSQLRAAVELAADAVGQTDYTEITTHAFCVDVEDWEQFQIDQRMPALGIDA